MIHPRPVPPEKPLPGDCCDGGCDPCVHDLYAEALRGYEAALASWRASGQGVEAEGGLEADGDGEAHAVGGAGRTPDGG